MFRFSFVLNFKWCHHIYDIFVKMSRINNRIMIFMSIPKRWWISWFSVCCNYELITATYHSPASPAVASPSAALWHRPPLPQKQNWYLKKYFLIHQVIYVYYKLHQYDEFKVLHNTKLNRFLSGNVIQYRNYFTFF